MLHLVQLDLLRQLADMPIHPDAREPLPPQLLQFLPIFSLTSTHQGGEHLEARALRQLPDLVDDLLHCLRGDHTATAITMWCPNASEQQTQIIINLRHGAYCGT